MTFWRTPLEKCLLPIPTQLWPQMFRREMCLNDPDAFGRCLGVRRHHCLRLIDDELPHEPEECCGIIDQCFLMHAQYGNHSPQVATWRPRLAQSLLPAHDGLS